MFLKVWTTIAFFTKRIYLELCSAGFYVYIAHIENLQMLFYRNIYVINPPKIGAKSAKHSFIVKDAKWKISIKFNVIRLDSTKYNDLSYIYSNTTHKLQTKVFLLGFTFLMVSSTVIIREFILCYNKVTKALYEGLTGMNTKRLIGGKYRLASKEKPKLFFKIPKYSSRILILR